MANVTSRRVLESSLYTALEQLVIGLGNRAIYDVLM
jgi:hypothetical protein